ncbi:MAG: tetratricopeptide repeat protein [Anaerolineae bacterium]|nr:tetratricopeptide repeat protein [Anaerolineae bacterium]NUQ02366.1 tetratricopeptide repeat protein [Anaerolineae bacterium]
MEQQHHKPAHGGPSPILLWISFILLFLFAVAAFAGFSYFASGQRLAALIPYAAVAVGGAALALVVGALLLRHHLPRLFWLWTILFVLVALSVGGVTTIWAYRSVLPPRYQEQFLTEVPLLRAFLPPTPQGGIVPTAAATSAFSAEDLLSAPLPIGTPTSVPPTPALATTLPPTATASSVPETPTLAPTLLPSATTPPTSVSVAPTEIAQQIVDSFAAPVASRIYGFTHVQQGWNNCGPANVTMALSYYGWQEDQDYAAGFLRPDREDKNVSPVELVAFVNEHTGVRAVTRIGGDTALLKQFIVNNIPVIIERSYTPEGYDWIGHYQTVVGYDDNAREFYVYDSYLGTGVAGAGLPESYTEFDNGWQAFNRVFIAIYEQDRESVVQNILGERADVNRAAEIALEVAREEARADRQNPFVWFNMGSALTKLGLYEEAARYFDEARRLNTPFRMLWYQFAPFEAYFMVQRYEDVLALVNNNLVNGGQYVEETFYWQGRALAALGRSQEAVTALQRALAQNPYFHEAQQALNALNV